MVQQPNPFATPATDATPQTSGGVRLQGDTIIMPIHSYLPPMCVRCGAPTENRIEITYRWHSPVIYLLLLFNLIIYAIAATIAQKRATFSVPLCDEHRASRNRFSWIGAWIALLGVAGCVAGLSQEAPAVAVPMAVLLPITGIIVFAIGRRTLNVKKIDKQFVYVSKLPPAIVARMMEDDR